MTIGLITMQSISFKIRAIISFFYNIFMSGRSLALPPVNSVYDVKAHLDRVIYTRDCIDTLAKPEITWGLKQGDCEDFALLAMALLKQIGFEGFLLSVICYDKRLSHAVCLFKQANKYSYFSNSKLVESNATDIEDVVYKIGGNNVRYWRLENINGKLVGGS